MCKRERSFFEKKFQHWGKMLNDNRMVLGVGFSCQRAIVRAFRRIP